MALRDERLVVRPCGRREGRCVVMTRVWAGGRGVGRVWRVWARRRRFSCVVGWLGESECAARRQRRARRYFSVCEGRRLVWKGFQRRG